LPVLKCFLYSWGTRGTDAPVDLKCLLQVGSAVISVAVPEVGLAESFQGVRFFRRRADSAGDLEGLAVVFAGLLSA